MSKLTVRPINTGYVPTYPKQYHYHHSVFKYRPNISEEKVPLPVFTFLIEGGPELILVDTGMAWTERANEYHHPGSYQPEGFAIHEQLAKIGYRCEDIGKVIFTHLHWDHMFYMEKFTRAQFIASRAEYEFALDPIPLYYKSYEHPALGIRRPFEGLKFDLVDGETEIVPGVRVFPTPGHSPGHQSVEVDTKDGGYILAGDSIFILANLEPVPEMHYPITPPGRFADIIACWKSIELQKNRAKRLDLILPCHEPAIEERVKQTPVFGL
ncbi:glyoxylase-like metal-dependent hydrolase (beta-lactamase superfamily II) [Hydrogenispora ethanolica]|jgi:glyoxylase-like metal-dependent hydrolase (beta-lactamase superfamily II)|uniref:Glyoxylase-like metal-dependent hydrolase (Beta-lactamase superfamily II) n=1 Tax=Hydrogenispora ethanolica TaxID=1082276 RepID=A0A4R1SDM2_HYDET|nr:N-acyl homoserine lactonase family protein [Hydrogenispora ethanolica]TCL76742.1 glyoxylase-like metal-dependent hydrolase (beta-lactamase superfamily II) [Hydrogenispora ethanolica]